MEEPNVIVRRKDLASILGELEHHRALLTVIANERAADRSKPPLVRANTQMIKKIAYDLIQEHPNATITDASFIAAANLRLAAEGCFLDTLTPISNKIQSIKRNWKNSVITRLVRRHGYRIITGVTFERSTLEASAAEELRAHLDFLGNSLCVTGEEWAMVCSSIITEMYIVKRSTGLNKWQTRAEEAREAFDREVNIGEDDSNADTEEVEQEREDDPFGGFEN